MVVVVDLLCHVFLLRFPCLCCLVLGNLNDRQIHTLIPNMVAKMLNAPINGLDELWPILIHIAMNTWWAFYTITLPSRRICLRTTIVVLDNTIHPLVHRGRSTTTTLLPSSTFWYGYQHPLRLNSWFDLLHLSPTSLLLSKQLRIADTKLTIVIQNTQFQPNLWLLNLKFPLTHCPPVEFECNICKCFSSLCTIYISMKWAKSWMTRGFVKRTQ